MSHHCTKSTNDKLLFFVNGKRVSSAHYRSQYAVNDNECLTKEQRKNLLNQSIANYENLQRDHTRLLSSCEEKLGRCNKRVTELEASLLKSASTFGKTCEKDKQALEKTIRSLRSSKSQNDDRKYDEELEKLRDTLRRTQSGFDEEKKSFTSKLASFNKERQTFETSIRDAQSRSAELEQKYQGILSEKNVIGQERDELRKEIEKLSLSIKELINERDECISNMSKMPKMKTEDKALQQTLEAEINEKATERATLLQQLKDISDDNKLLISQRDALLRQSSKHENERRALTERLQQTEREIESMKNERDDLFRQLEEMKGNRTQSSELKEEIRLIQQTLQETTNERDTLRQQLKEMSGERDSLASKNIEMTNAVESLTSAREALLEKHNISLREIEQYKTAIDVYKQNINDLTKEVADCKSGCASQIDALNEAFAQKERGLIETISRLEERVTALNKALGEEQTAHSNIKKKFGKMQSKYGQVQNDFAKEQTAHSQTTEKYTKYKENQSTLFREMQDQLNDFSQKLDDCNKTCERTTLNLREAFRNDLSERDTTITKFTETQKALESQNQALEEKVNAINKEIEKTKADFEVQKRDFEQQLVAEKSRYDQNMIELKAMRDNLEISRTNYANEKETLDKNHSEALRQIRAEFEQVKAEKSALNAKLAQTEKELESISLANQKIQQLLDTETVNTSNLTSTNRDLVAKIDALINSQEYKEGLAMKETRSKVATENDAREKMIERQKQEQEKQEREKIERERVKQNQERLNREKESVKRQQEREQETEKAKQAEQAVTEEYKQTLKDKRDNAKKQRDTAEQALKTLNFQVIQLKQNLDSATTTHNRLLTHQSAKDLARKLKDFNDAETDVKEKETNLKNAQQAYQQAQQAYNSSFAFRSKRSTKTKNKTKRSPSPKKTKRSKKRSPSPKKKNRRSIRR